jgi:hypothetical protein
LKIISPHHPRGYGQLVRGKTQGRHGEVFSDSAYLEHDVARLNHCYPVVYGSLASAHAYLCGFLAHGFVREKAHPDSATTT